MTANEISKSTSPKIKTVLENEVVHDDTPANKEKLDEDIRNHFTEIPIDFLQDITEIFDELNITDMDTALNFDTQVLSSRLIAKGRMADLVKDLLNQWQKALQEAIEQQKRIDEEIERKKRAKRPVWRCAVCGRPSNPGCPVAPYIAYYIDVDI